MPATWQLSFSKNETHFDINRIVAVFSYKLRPYFNTHLTHIGIVLGRCGCSLLFYHLIKLLCRQVFDLEEELPWSVTGPQSGHVTDRHYYHRVNHFHFGFTHSSWNLESSQYIFTVFAKHEWKKFIFQVQRYFFPVRFWSNGAYSVALSTTSFAKKTIIALTMWRISTNMPLIRPSFFIWFQKTKYPDAQETETYP